MIDVTNSAMSEKLLPDHGAHHILAAAGRTGAPVALVVAIGFYMAACRVLATFDIDVHA